MTSGICGVDNDGNGLKVTSVHRCGIDHDPLGACGPWRTVGIQQCCVAARPEAADHFAPSGTQGQPKTKSIRERHQAFETIGWTLRLDFLRQQKAAFTSRI